METGVTAQPLEPQDEEDGQQTPISEHARHTECEGSHEHRSGEWESGVPAPDQGVTAAYGDMSNPSPYHHSIASRDSISSGLSFPAATIVSSPSLTSAQLMDQTSQLRPNIRYGSLPPIMSSSDKSDLSAPDLGFNSRENPVQIPGSSSATGLWDQMAPASYAHRALNLHPLNHARAHSSERLPSYNFPSMGDSDLARPRSELGDRPARSVPSQVEDLSSLTRDGQNDLQRLKPTSSSRNRSYTDPSHSLRVLPSIVGNTGPQESGLVDHPSGAPRSVPPEYAQFSMTRKRARDEMQASDTSHLPPLFNDRSNLSSSTFNVQPEGYGSRKRLRTVEWPQEEKRHSGFAALLQGIEQRQGKLLMPGISDDLQQLAHELSKNRGPQDDDPADPENAEHGEEDTEGSPGANRMINGQRVDEDGMPWTCFGNPNCLTRSPPRKVISHYFGRNKSQTKAIQKKHWVMMCRKHYQRASYRDSHKFHLLKYGLIQRFLENCTEIEEIEDWTIQWMKGRQTRIREFAMSSPSERERNPLPEKDVGWDHLDALMGTGRTLEDVQDFVRTMGIRIQHEEAQIPDVEMLPNFRKAPATKKPRAKGRARASTNQTAISTSSTDLDGSPRFGRMMPITSFGHVQANLGSLSPSMSSRPFSYGLPPPLPQLMSTGPPPPVNSLLARNISDPYPVTTNTGSSHGPIPPYGRFTSDPYQLSLGSGLSNQPGADYYQSSYDPAPPPSHQSYQNLSRMKELGIPAEQAIQNLNYTYGRPSYPQYLTAGTPSNVNTSSLQQLNAGLPQPGTFPSSSKTAATSAPHSSLGYSSNLGFPSAISTSSTKPSFVGRFPSSASNLTQLQQQQQQQQTGFTPAMPSGGSMMQPELLDREQTNDDAIMRARAWSPRGGG